MTFSIPITRRHVDGWTCFLSTVPLTDSTAEGQSTLIAGQHLSKCLMEFRTRRQSGCQESSLSASHEKLENGGAHIGQETEPKTDTNGSRLTLKQWLLLLTLGYGQFWIAACVSLQAPFFPKEAEMKGATPSQYGLVFGVFELVIVVMSPVYGKMVVWTKPKFLVTAGVFLAGSACILFGFIDQSPGGTPFLTLAFLIRIVEGFGSAGFITASFTVIASEFPGRVATTFSVLETWFGVGLIAGPTIGGALYQVGGFRLPFVVLGSCLVVGSLLCYLSLPSMDQVDQQKAGNMKAFLMDAGIIMNALAIISTLTFIGYNAATLEPHLREFGLSPFFLGLIFVITGAIYAITTPLWGWLCDKGVNTDFLCIFGYALSIVGILLIGPVPWIPFEAQLWTVIVSLVVLGFGLSSKLVCALIGSLQDTIKIRGYPDDLTTHGMVSAMFSSSCSIGAFAGPSIGGYLLENYGYASGTVVLMVEEITLLTVLVAYVVWKKRYKRHEAGICEERRLLFSSNSYKENKLTLEVSQCEEKSFTRNSSSLEEITHAT